MSNNVELLGISIKATFHYVRSVRAGKSVHCRAQCLSVFTWPLCSLIENKTSAIKMVSEKIGRQQVGKF